MPELTSPEKRAAIEPLAAWAERLRLDRRPFSFEGHEYLRDIYNDQSHHIVLVKAAQIGGTTWAILRVFHACLRGLNGMYFFPTQSDVLDFSKGRVAPLIAENPFLQKAIQDTDTAGLKRIGDAFLYLRGMQSTVGMKSVPADLIVFDELDEATPDAKALARERLSHSDYRRIIELSNPSFPGCGVDEAFQETDQRHWTIRCGPCGEWTALDKEFPVRLGEEIRILLQHESGTWYRACRKCGAELDVTAGEWVADFPGRDSHGYLISQLISSKVDPEEIVREYRRTRHPDRFYSLKIGIAWVDDDNRLTVQMVLALCGESGMETGSSERTTMGVDTGRDLHVVIGRRRYGEDKRRIIYVGVHQSFAELDDLMRRFNVGRCVIDGLPETHKTREFANRHRGRVFMNFFKASQRDGTHWDKENHVVQENRTDALDASRQAIRQGDVILPRQSKIVEEFAAHMAHDVKRLVENEETGAQECKYIRTGTNHLSMAFTYENIAAEQRFVVSGAYVPGPSAGRNRISITTGLGRMSVAINNRRQER